MKKYNNILVVAEPKKDVQVALKRALDITQFNPKATKIGRASCRERV